jgi:hypothetical protein
MERATAPRALPSWAVLLLALLAAFVAHSGLLGCTFFSDDFEVLWRLRMGGGSSFFRPLADLSLRINLWLTGPDPWVFRAVNVALLGFNGWLVYLLAKRVCGDAAALLSALLFILYPFHLEPQAWIIGRGIALASAFTLGALVVATGDAPATARTSVVALLTLLGALCYESALLAPALLGAWWLIRRPADQPVWRAMVMASSAAVAVNLMLRWFFLGGLANDYGAAFFAKPMNDYLASAVKVIGRSLLPPLDDPSAQAVRFGLLGIGLLLIALVHWRTNRADPERLRAAALLVALFGISGIIAVLGGVSTRTSESDRFLYLPSAFLCMLIALFIGRITSRPVRLALSFAIIALAFHQLRAGMENWREASRIIARIVATTPEPPSDGRLLVLGLPSDAHGAYIFRHGYREALQFAGRDAERIMAMDTPGAPPVEPLRTDLVVRWAGTRFVVVSAP